MHCEKVMYFLNIFVVIQILLVYHTGCSELPPAEFPKDNATFRILTIQSSKTSKTPPSVFPENDSNYKVIQNTTILKDLKNHSENKESKIDTEVSDLIIPVHNESVSIQQDKKIPESVTVSDKDTNPDMDQELIESDVSKTEDVKLDKSAETAGSVHLEHNHPLRAVAPVLQGQLAGIVAAIFAFIAVSAYVGLFMWRRYLEHRYGNRQMLINEEDHINYNDMKNFEI